MLIFLLAFAALAGSAALDFQRFAQTPLQLEEAQTIQIQAGATQSGLLEQWLQRGWLAYPRDRLWLKIYQRLAGIPTRIQRGEYRLHPGMTLPGTLAMLRRGEVVRYQLTIVEGWTFAQLRQALRNQDALDKQTGNWSDAQIMQALDPTKREPEGRFLPETYTFTRGSSDLELLQRAFSAMEQALASAWESRKGDLPLKTPYEALILASIVEKETGRADERERIAGVFVERLRRGMRLQTDPTVIYGLGQAFDGNLRRRDLRADTPYNTYTRHGLPPTPIALPGRAALRAAVHPEVTGDLYFVSRGDGSHVFSRTLEAHREAVKRYQLR